MGAGLHLCRVHPAATPLPRRGAAHACQRPAAGPALQVRLFLVSEPAQLATLQDACLLCACCCGRLLWERSSARPSVPCSRTSSSSAPLLRWRMLQEASLRAGLQLCGCILLRALLLGKEQAHPHPAAWTSCPSGCSTELDTSSAELAAAELCKRCSWVALSLWSAQPTGRSAARLHGALVMSSSATQQYGAALCKRSLLHAAGSTQHQVVAPARGVAALAANLPGNAEHSLSLLARMRHRAETDALCEALQDLERAGLPKHQVVAPARGQRLDQDCCCRILSVLGPPSTKTWPLLEALPHWQECCQAMPALTVNSTRAPRPPAAALALLLSQRGCVLIC